MAMFSILIHIFILCISELLNFSTFSHSALSPFYSFAYSHNSNCTLFIPRNSRFALIRNSFQFMFMFSIVYDYYLSSLENICSPELLPLHSFVSARFRVNLVYLFTVIRLQRFFSSFFFKDRKRVWHSGMENTYLPCIFFSLSFSLLLHSVIRLMLLRRIAS